MAKSELTLRDVMNEKPVLLSIEASCADAAREMKARNVGAILVEASDGELRGIVTDRDIVVDCIATNGDPNQTKLDAMCRDQVVSLKPSDSLNDAIRSMQDHAVRRLPVLDDGKAVGIVSLGDLAANLDPDSVLGKISAAPANN